jgi:methylated-DNA-protein-cysteine methyltransferase-like protein
VKSADDRLQRILATVEAVPRGKVASYGQIAREALLPGRARLVGRVLRDLPASSKLPWHRIVRADGSIAGRGDGAAMTEQRKRLAREGVKFDSRGRVDLATYGARANSPR